jgi:hypothetical protein
MVKAIKGRYKNGTVELYGKPDVPEGNVIIIQGDQNVHLSILLHQESSIRKQGNNW